MNEPRNLTAETLHAAMTAAIGTAARRAWRQLTPDWQAAEAEVALLAAVTTVQQHRPDLDERGAVLELFRLGILTRGRDGNMVTRVPALADPLPATSSRAN